MIKIKLLIFKILILSLVLIFIYCANESNNLIYPWKAFNKIVQQGKLLEMEENKLTVEYNDIYNHESPKELLIEYTKIAQNDGWEKMDKSEKTISNFANQFMKNNFILIIEMQYGRGTVWAKLKIKEEIGK